MCVVHVRSSEIAKGNIHFLYDKLYIIFVFTSQLCIYAVFGIFGIYLLHNY